MRPKRIAYAVLGLLATVLGIAVVVTQHASWWPLVVLAIAPDLSLLVGMSGNLERGRLHPRAVPLYNAVHRFWVPAILVVVTLLLRSNDWLAGGLAWIAHIGFDRSLGFGLRTKEGFQRR
jgi:hypothetical protein